MRKVKGFKLVLRPHEVKRRAKKAGVELDVPALQEPVLAKTLDRLAKSLQPAVLFDTFGHPDPDQSALSPLPGLAYSLILATLGDGFASAKATELIPEAVWPVLEETALDECVRFASGLIADEAEKDNCELSPISAVEGGAALEAALRKLDGGKIGVSCGAVGLLPQASLAVSLSWLAKSKAKGRK